MILNESGGWVSKIVFVVVGNLKAHFFEHSGMEQMVARKAHKRFAVRLKVGGLSPSLATQKLKSDECNYYFSKNRYQLCFGLLCWANGA